MSMKTVNYTDGPIGQVALSFYSMLRDIERTTGKKYTNIYNSDLYRKLQ